MPMFIIPEPNISEFKAVSARVAAEAAGPSPAPPVPGPGRWTCVSESTKACKKCGEEKPVTLFYADRKSRGGRRGECKVCQGLIRTLARKIKLDLERDRVAGHGDDIAESNEGERHQRSHRVPHPTRQARAHFPSSSPYVRRNSGDAFALLPAPTHAAGTRLRREASPIRHQANMVGIQDFSCGPPPVLARYYVSLP